MIPFTVSKLLTHPLLWRFVGFGSSIVGFSCYALSPSFYDLFGKFNLLKFVIYCVVSMFVSCLMLFANKCRRFEKSFLVKAQVGFLILTLTSLYSFWEDRASQQGNEEKGHGRILNLSSSGAFALMSLSLSRQLQLGFEVGIFNFFLGCFLVTLMKMNFKLAPVAAFFCYMLINIRYCSDYLLEMRGGGGESAETGHVDIESNSHNVAGQDLHDDEFAETKHEDMDFPVWNQPKRILKKSNVVGQDLAYDDYNETEQEDMDFPIWSKPHRILNKSNVIGQDLPYDDYSEIKLEDMDFPIWGKPNRILNKSNVVGQDLAYDDYNETEHEDMDVPIWSKDYRILNKSNVVGQDLANDDYNETEHEDMYVPIWIKDYRILKKSNVIG